MIEYCICGHSYNSHLDSKYLCGGCEVCASWTFNDKMRVNWFHPFKLDNLKYVEDLAKERNLV